MNVLEKILEEIENISYYPEGMGCGIEDCGITDGYEACEYGWNKAIEAVIETINNMDEATSEKEKVTSAEIISRQIDGKPYYEIKFKKVGEDEYTMRYSSFKLNHVVKWLNDRFEFAGEAKASCDNDGWIPVEERLPEEKINPITKDFYVYPVTFELDGVRDIRYYPFGMGHWWKATEIMDEYVKAWMPIPASYKPKEKNNE